MTRSNWTGCGPPAGHADVTSLGGTTETNTMLYVNCKSIKICVCVCVCVFLIYKANLGLLGGSVFEGLPLALGVTLGSRDRVPYPAPHREPASPSACVSASLSVSLMSK